MKLNYKKLGNYIESCDILNEDMNLTLLQGISNEKYFQSCKSNTVDIDLSKYRVCRKGWFAYNRATTRNGEKISIAYREKEDCLVSPSYKCFRIMDEKQLSPYYLLLWFKRPEFDRYARFMSHGSAHEYFEYEQLTEVQFPVPPIEEQKKIVDAYQKIETRITLKKKTNENLEKQAIAMFHALFDDQNTWKDGVFADLGEIVGGATPSKENAEYFCDNGIVWLTPKDLTSTGLKFIYKGETDITKTAYQSCSTKIMPQGTVLLTSRAPVGSVAIAMVDLCTNQGFKSIVPKKKIGTAYVYYFLKENKQLLDSYSSGTTFMEISGNVLKSIPTKIPPYILTEKFTQLCKPIFSYQAKLELEIMKLNQLLAVINSSLVSC